MESEASGTAAVAQKWHQDFSSLLYAEVDL